MRYMRYLLVFIILSATQAFADCLVLDITPWTPEQRGFLSHVVAVAVDGIGIRKSFVDDNRVKICAHVDLPALDSATLQGTAQAIVVEHTASNDLQRVEIDTARNEVRTNTLCNASLEQVVIRIDAEKAAIQTDINAATDLVKARAALTTINNRYGATLEFIVRCVTSRATLARTGQ